MSEFEHFFLNPRDVVTFEELFGAYLCEWPEAAADAYSERWSSCEAYADHLLRQAEHVAADFPDIELWDHLEQALRHSMRWHDARKGLFEKLFERNLRERMAKAVARAREQARRRRQAEMGHALSRPGLATGEADPAFVRWAALLLDRACGRLDPATRTYVQMRRRGERVATIARVLGLSEREVKNRYGGQKLARKARRAVRAVVLALPDTHRRLLPRHLLEEAGLPSSTVRALLGVTTAVDGSVPVLEEGPLLTALGWADENLSDWPATGETAGSTYCERRLRSAG